MAEEPVCIAALKAIFVSAPDNVIEEVAKTSSTQGAAINSILARLRSLKNSKPVRVNRAIRAVSSDTAPPLKKICVTGRDIGSEQRISAADDISNVKKKKVKNEHGYVGIVNKGATCYMNSLLQTLFFTNSLRKAVYKLPTESDDPTTSVSFALQRLFFELQFSTEIVETRKLIRSFGWHSWNAFLMHDVQELCRVLLDNIEKKMSNTIVDGAIKTLFEGRTESYTRCMNVDYESRRVELYNDIQLTVKRKKSVYEAFDDYIAVETMLGDNKYDAGHHGLQVAKKGVVFLSFPPVLHLHLMRFQYDAVNDLNIKINDRYKFPETLMLQQYLKEPDKSNPATYVLHTVLVHIGCGYKGHYIVYISPKANGQWYKFDDDKVSSCSKQEAISDNFGGQSESAGNAYMLVYIRKSQLATLLQDITTADIPDSLKNRLQEEKSKEVRAAKEKAEAHLYMPIRVVTDSTLMNDYQGYDLFDTKHFKHESFKVKKTASLIEFLDTVATSMQFDASQLRAWPFESHEYRVSGRDFLRQDYRDVHKLRATFPDLDDEDKENPKQVFELSKKQYPWTIYIETPEDSTKDKCALKTLPKFDKNNDVLLFFKRYNSQSRCLTNFCHMIVCKQNCLADVVPLLNERSGCLPTTALKFYQEVKLYEVDLILSLNEPLEKAICAISNGDILIFEEVASGMSQNPIDEYYCYLADRISVKFREKSVYRDEGFTIELLQTSTYEELSMAVTKQLGIEPYHVQFYECKEHGEPEGASYIINYPKVKRWTLSGVLQEWRYGCFKPIFYEKLDIPITEKDQRMKFTCMWFDSEENEERQINVYPFKKDDNKNCVADILEEAKKQMVLKPGGTGKLRLLETSDRYISNWLHDSQSFMEINLCSKQRGLYIEEIPTDQLVLTNDERIVPVAQYNPKSQQLCCAPFMVKVINGEKFSQMKDRLRPRIDMNDDAFEKLEFVEVIGKKETRLPKEDFTITSSHFTELAGKNLPQPSVLMPYLRLDQLQTRATTTVKKRTYDGSIKIFN